MLLLGITELNHKLECTESNDFIDNAQQFACKQNLFHLVIDLNDDINTKNPYIFLLTKILRKETSGGYNENMDNNQYATDSSDVNNETDHEIGADQSLNVDNQLETGTHSYSQLVKLKFVHIHIYVYCTCTCSVSEEKTPPSCEDDTLDKVKLSIDFIPVLQKAYSEEMIYPPEINISILIMIAIMIAII